MITEEMANKVWDVLIEHAGASSHDADRLAFVISSVGEDRLPEYRFQGALGFGGKVYLRDRRGWEVYYYPEDRSQKRDAIVSRTNAALFAIPTDLP